SDLLIDRKANFDFLPLLPDTIGRAITPEFLSCPIDVMVKKRDLRFIVSEVTALSLEKKEILTTGGVVPYDYLVIASGTETNFYGNENIRQSAYALDNVADARTIRSAITQNQFNNYIVSGGGYTGIEAATNIRLFLARTKKNGKVVIIERSPSILGQLPQWMKEYVHENLKRLNVDVVTNSAIERIEGGSVYVSGGVQFDNAFTLWAAGVKTSAFIQNLAVEKNPQGRIRVDRHLRLNDRCFVIGDAALFSYHDSFLRMAVQFAIMQGLCAADNVLRSMEGRKLKTYIPLDLGYLVPMANDRSCGIVFGLRCKGRLSTILHFLMCIYRTCSFKNQWGLLRDLLR
ncbi:MAG: FAD-dependent oxidoreductase, partial [Candidatus Omnitrophica bacterium]|nr:FAD-dependent oxidoreductase [Candidatus Omnitrophota bacterium]